MKKRSSSGKSTRKLVTSHPSGERAVVLVHGIFDTGKIFGRMARFLRDHAWTPYAIDLKPNDGRRSLDELALQLKSYIDEHMPAERVNLIGFSMGGLVARYYVQRLGGIPRVRRFITLSTPHNGSLLAYLLLNKGCAQMRPGSAFLADLNRDAATLEQVGFVSLWTPWDLSVLPASSSVLPIGHHVKLPVALHPLMVWDQRCLNEVARLLEN